MDLAYLYRTFYSTTAEYMLLSSTYATLSKKAGNKLEQIRE